jgi:pimeloyl-ACP methyl ester carboxylesterase
MMASILAAIGLAAVARQAEARDVASVLQHARAAYAGLHSLKETWVTDSWFFFRKSTFQTTLTASGRRSRYRVTPLTAATGQLPEYGLIWWSSQYAAPVELALDGATGTFRVGDACCIQPDGATRLQGDPFAHLPDPGRRVRLLPHASLAGRPVYLLAWDEPVNAGSRITFRLFLNRATYLMERSEGTVHAANRIEAHWIDRLVGRTVNSPVPARSLRFTARPADHPFKDRGQFQEWLGRQQAAHTPLSNDLLAQGDPLPIHLRYTDVGRGEPVVVIHHFVGDLRGRLNDWLESTLNARIITLECRGQGGSDESVNPAEYGPEMARDVVRLLDHLHLRKARIVGAGIGAVIAGRLLADYPDRVDRAVLLGGPPLLASLLQPGQPLQNLLNRTVDALVDRKGLPTEWWLAVSREQRRELADTQAWAGPFETQSRHVLEQNHVSPGALTAMLRGLPQLAVNDRKLAANRVPVLAIVGAEDPIKADPDYLQMHVPHAKVIACETNLWRYDTDWENYLGNIVPFLSRP